AHEPSRGLALQLEEPVVVAPDAPASEVGILVARRTAAVEDVDPDAVAIHVLQTRLHVPRARAHVLVEDADLVGAVLASGHERQARDGVSLPVYHPDVALGRGLDARHALGEPRRRVALPEVARRVHVG